MEDELAYGKTRGHSNQEPPPSLRLVSGFRKFSNGIRRKLSSSQLKEDASLQDQKWASRQQNSSLRKPSPPDSTMSGDSGLTRYMTADSQSTTYVHHPITSPAPVVTRSVSRMGGNEGSSGGMFSFQSKNKTPEWYVKRIINYTMTLKNYRALEKTLRHRRANKDWIKDFVNLQGHMTMAVVLHQISQRTIKSNDQLDIEYSILTSIRNVMNFQEKQDGMIRMAEINRFVVPSLTSPRIITRNAATSMLALSVAYEKETAVKNILKGLKGMLDGPSNDSESDLSSSSEEKRNVFESWIHSAEELIADFQSENPHLVFSDEDFLRGRLTPQSIIKEYTLLTIFLISSIVTTYNDVAIRVATRKMLEDVGLLRLFNYAKSLHSDAISDLVTNYLRSRNQDIDEMSKRRQRMLGRRQLRHHQIASESQESVNEVASIEEGDEEMASGDDATVRHIRQQSSVDDKFRGARSAFRDTSASPYINNILANLMEVKNTKEKDVALKYFRMIDQLIENVVHMSEISDKSVLFFTQMLLEKLSTGDTARMAVSEAYESERKLKEYKRRVHQLERQLGYDFEEEGSERSSEGLGIEAPLSKKPLQPRSHLYHVPGSTPPRYPQSVSEGDLSNDFSSSSYFEPYDNYDINGVNGTPSRRSRRRGMMLRSSPTKGDKRLDQLAQLAAATKSPSSPVSPASPVAGESSSADAPPPAIITTKATLSKSSGGPPAPPAPPMPPQFSASRTSSAAAPPPPAPPAPPPPALPSFFQTAAGGPPPPPPPPPPPFPNAIMKTAEGMSPPKKPVMTRESEKVAKILSLKRPEAKLKHLHWDGVHDVENTFWDTVDDERIINMLDRAGILTDMETSFRALDTSAKLRKMKAQEQKKPKKLTLLPRELQQQFGINLHQYGSLSESEFVAKVLSCDKELLTNSSLVEFFNWEGLLDISSSLMMKFGPYSKGLMSTKATSKLDPSVLDRFDRIYLDLCFNLRSYWPARARALILATAYERDYHDLLKKLNQVDRAVFSVRHSESLLQVFNIIKSIGNYLNDSNKVVVGFKLSALQRLRFLKDSKNRMTLLHYLEKMIRAHFPDLAVFVDDLKELQKVAGLSLPTLEAEIEEYQKAVTNCITSFEKGSLSDKSKLHPDDRIIEYMKPILGRARRRADALHEHASTMSKEFDKLMQYFGEDSDDKESKETFFGKIASFADSYKKVHTENVRAEEETRAYEVRKKMMEDVRSRSQKHHLDEKDDDEIENDGATEVIENLLTQLKTNKPSRKRSEVRNEALAQSRKKLEERNSTDTITKAQLMLKDLEKQGGVKALARREGGRESRESSFRKERKYKMERRSGKKPLSKRADSNASASISVRELELGSSDTDSDQTIGAFDPHKPPEFNKPKSLTPENSSTKSSGRLSIITMLISGPATKELEALSANGDDDDDEGLVDNPMVPAIEVGNVDEIVEEDEEEEGEEKDGEDGGDLSEESFHTPGSRSRESSLDVAINHVIRQLGMTT